MQPLKSIIASGLSCSREGGSVSSAGAGFFLCSSFWAAPVSTVSHFLPPSSCEKPLPSLCLIPTEYSVETEAENSWVRPVEEAVPMCED